MSVLPVDLAEHYGGARTAGAPAARAPRGRRHDAAADPREPPAGAGGAGVRRHAEDAGDFGAGYGTAEPRPRQRAGSGRRRPRSVAGSADSGPARPPRGLRPALFPRNAVGADWSRPSDSCRDASQTWRTAIRYRNAGTNQRLAISGTSGRPQNTTAKGPWEKSQRCAFHASSDDHGGVERERHRRRCRRRDRRERRSPRATKPRHRRRPSRSRRCRPTEAQNRRNRGSPSISA